MQHWESLLDVMATQAGWTETGGGQGFRRDNFQHELKPQSLNGPAGCSMMGTSLAGLQGLT